MAIKILFCFYPLYVKYNHGIALLSSLCKAFDIDTEIYLLDNIDNFNKYLQYRKFDYIAYSCVTKKDYMLSLPFMYFTDAIGYFNLLGGVYPRYGFSINAPVKVICRGDGEMLPLFLTNNYLKIFETPDYYKDLNNLPLPDYDLFKSIPYNRKLPLGDFKKPLPYSSSRGCPFRCSFCATNLQPNGVRIRTKVGNDLDYLVSKYTPDVIHFMDELIPYYDNDWKESWNNFRFPFIAYIRADIKESDLLWLIDRGLSGCFFGIESGNEEFRNKILGKNLSDKQINETINILNANKIPYIASYIQGVPGESWELQADTVEFSRKIGGNPIFYQYENVIGA